ncbi:MAG: DUF2236 domain-containing protein [Deltaproteobacteria bacterium]|nr:DUF2236 domain-containing protein [Deltaproteobacteria bacterium]MBW2394289.1 DUF2236 domain-containing protein [Deltaproteobacteria bacterium]
MLNPSRRWMVLGALYVAFFSWYTSFGGPLTPEEIDTFVSTLQERDAPPETVARFRRFMESDTGDDFVMLNAIQLNDVPKPVPGVEAGDTSEDVLRKYTGPFMGRALRSAAHPVLFGTAAAPAVDVWGIEGADDWSAGGVIRYRSRRDLMEQAVAVGPSGIHDFKIAAMAKTIAFPLDPWFQLGDPRLLLALILGIIGLMHQKVRSSK